MDPPQPDTVPASTPTRRRRFRQAKPGTRTGDAGRLLVLGLLTFAAPNLSVSVWTGAALLMVVVAPALLILGSAAALAGLTVLVLHALGRARERRHPEAHTPTWTGRSPAERRICQALTLACGWSLATTTVGILAQASLWAVLGQLLSTP